MNTWPWSKCLTFAAYNDVHYFSLKITISRTISKMCCTELLFSVQELFYNYCSFRFFVLIGWIYILRFVTVFIRHIGQCTWLCRLFWIVITVLNIINESCLPEFWLNADWFLLVFNVSIKNDWNTCSISTVSIQVYCTYNSLNTLFEISWLCVIKYF